MNAFERWAEPFQNEPQQLSPNALWCKLGATIERHTKPIKHRVITLPDGRSFSAIQPRHSNETKLAEMLLAEG